MDDRAPNSDRLRRLASRYEAAVGRGRAEQIAARAITRAHRRSPVGRRLAMALSTGGFLIVSMTGVGMAANGSIPGDVLYPLDRALEAVGLTSDLVEERLSEAIVLAERGDGEAAAQTATEALHELGRKGINATLPTVTSESEMEAASLTVESSGQESAPSTTVASSGDEPGSETVDTEEASSVEVLRLAAEALLQSVRTAKLDPSSSGQVTTAALFLAEVTASATTTDSSTSSTSSSTTSSTSSTTTTTAPTDPKAGSGNGKGGDSDTGTTTTTVASDSDDGSGSADSGSDGGSGPGPIFLPSP